MHHQFRYIRTEKPSKGMVGAMPRLIPFMARGKSENYNSMFGHELAHCINMVDRGQKERLKLPNFGWPVRVGYFNANTATTECKVFAIQYLLEQLYNGELDKHGMLDVYSANLFMSVPQTWEAKNQREAWLAEGTPRSRTQSYMEQYQPKIQRMLDTTVDYIVDECSEFV